MSFFSLMVLSFLEVVFFDEDFLACSWVIFIPPFEEDGFLGLGELRFGLPIGRQRLVWWSCLYSEVDLTLTDLLQVRAGPTFCR
jgi:hypothetical protein